ncbi:orotate phosphoribosyltransferase [Halobacteriovorax sp. DPLXC-1]|uniref:orotate phosphoribosyltransferase n=1 Tax=Halobacteriovorax sp. DPLXC-1 TaxID=3110771 RepID=UPI002FF4131A
MHSKIQDLVKEMIKFGLIKISPQNPFKYASGKEGPIYCDNRLMSSDPKMWALAIELLSETINNKNLKYDFITGVATAGISHAAALAYARKEPMNYVRSKPKSHGTGKIVEGKVGENSKLLLVEDLVNQGSSIEKVIRLIRDQGHVVDSVLCLVDYQTPNAKKVAKELEIDIFSLINLNQLADICLSEDIINKEGHQLLMRWQQDPDNWQV